VAGHHSAMIGLNRSSRSTAWKYFTGDEVADKYFVD
jgi:hypothetical protein